MTVGSVDATSLFDPEQRADPGMTNVLVCVKRVPDSSGEVLLTADGQAVDGRYVGFTISNHEACAVELAVQIAGATGGEATVLDPRAPPRRSSSSAPRWRSAARPRPTWSPTRSARPRRRGRRDRRGRRLTRPRAAPRPGAARQRRRRHRRLPGRHPARLRARPPGRQRGRRRSRSRTARRRGRGEGPDRHETYELPLPGGRHRARGRRRAALPDGSRPDEGQEDRDRGARSRRGEPRGSKRVTLTLPPPVPSQVQILGEGAAAAPAVVRPASSGSG